MEKIDEVKSTIKNGKIERCQELAEGKKLKLLRIADREEDRWEVIKCHLLDI